MKRVKKITCAVFIIISIILSFSMLIVNGAESDKIYFQVPDDWGSVKQIYCHVWENGGDGFFGWQAKAEKCTDEGDGLWSYDLSLLDSEKAEVAGGFSSDKIYAVIFSSNTGWQTYDLNLVSACVGDTADTNGEIAENPVDASKSCVIARWKKNGDTVHPVVQHNSSGTLVDPDKVGKDNQVKVAEQKNLQEESAKESSATPIETGENSSLTIIICTAMLFVLLFTALFSFTFNKKQSKNKFF